MKVPSLSRNLSTTQINKIVELTLQGCNRGEIAEEVGCNKKTVYLYQIKYNLR